MERQEEMVQRRGDVNYKQNEFGGCEPLAFGMFISAVSRNQITAGTLTFGLLLILYIVGSLSPDLPQALPVPESWPAMASEAVNGLYGGARAFMVELKIDAHASEMSQGILQPKDIAYYMLMSAFFIFLTFRALESRHWRG